MNKTAQKYKIGPSIALDGEKEYKQAISAVNKTMKDLDSQLKLTKSEFLGNENSLKSLRAQYAKQEEIVQTQKEKVEALKGALDNAKKTYGENSDQVQKWQLSLNKATEEFNKQNHAFEEMKKSATGIGAVKTGLSEIKDKAHEVAEKTEKARKVLGALGKVSLKTVTTSMKAVGAAAGAVVAGAAAAGKGLWDMANKAAAAGNEIDKASQRMNVSAEEYQKLKYTADLTGVSMTSLETAAKTLQKSGSDLDLTSALKQVADIKDPAERSAKAMELFGSKAGYQLAPMLNAGSDGIEDMMNKAEKLGIVMSNKSVNASAKFKDSLSTLTGVLTGVKNNLAAQFLPGFTTVIDGVTGLFSGEEGATQKIRKGVHDIAETFQTIRPRIEEILKTVIETIATLAPEVISTLISGISQNLEPLFSTAKSVLMSLVDGIIDNLDEILDTAFEIIKTLADALLDKENLQKILNAAVNFLITMVTGIADSIDTVIEAAVMIIDTVTAALTNEENMPKLLKAALDILVAVVSGLIKAIPNVLADIGTFLASLADAFLSYDWAGVGHKIWVAIKSALSGQKLEVGAETTVHVSSSGVEHSSGGGSIPKHATGLYAVPYDGYIAELHKNERILNAEEARLYNTREARAGANVGNSTNEIRALQSEVRELRRFLQSGSMSTKAEISNTRDMRKMVAAYA